MLRILDARTGEPVTAAPARRGLTRIEAHASGPDPTALRVLLTADLLVRALELGGTPVWPTLAAPHSPTDLRTAAATLAIRPFEDARDVASGLGEAQTLHVTAELPDGSGGGPVVWVAAVEWRGEPAGGQGTDLVEGHARASAPGHVPEPAPGHARESGPGHVSEPGPSHAAELATGREPESAPESVPEPAPGLAPEPVPGRTVEPAPGRAPEPAAGRTTGPVPGHASGPAGHAPEPPAGQTAEPVPGRTVEPALGHAPEPVPGRTAEPAPGRAPEPAPAHAPEPTSHPPLAVLLSGLSDPCALRLALLSVPRGEPVRLDSGMLEEAAGWLDRWRRAVARWARQPSRPVPDDVRARLRAAWEDDLDLPGVLEVLRTVESAGDLPDGARFETYVYADRLLALDLARDLGSLA